MHGDQYPLCSLMNVSAALQSSVSEESLDSVILTENLAARRPPDAVARLFKRAEPLFRDGRSTRASECLNFCRACNGPKMGAKAEAQWARARMASIFAAIAHRSSCHNQNEYLCAQHVLVLANMLTGAPCMFINV